MRQNGRQTLSRVVDWIRVDLRTDPFLKYLLLLALALSGFFLWYSVPNFTRPDEYTRLVDAMVAANYVFADPSSGALGDGITHGRALGASFYLSALALVPGYLIAIATGQFDLIVSANTLRSRWEIWQTLPEWFWTTSLLTGRVLVVLFAVGCVYLTYRIGRTMRDRTAGLLAGLLLTLSFSFLRSAHEFAEDIPSIFFLLFAFFLALRYIETGDKTTFLAGCAAGGIAIAFKLLAGVAVVVLGMAYLLHARRARADGNDAFAPLVRPSLLAGGLALGAGAVVVGFPSVLVSGLDPLVDRLLQSTADKNTVARNGSTPILHQFIQFYAGGLGIPLAVSSGCGVLANLPRLRGRGSEANGVVLALTALSVYLLVYSRWVYVQPHHLLQTFPLFALLAGVAFSQLDARWPLLARPLVAILVITTGLYTGVGLLGYTSDADNAPERWIATEVPPDATMEIHVPRPQLAAPLHGRPVGHYVSPGIDTYDRLKGEGWNPTGFNEWRDDTTERNPDYIQMPRYARQYTPAVVETRYTVVARFIQDWPLRDTVGILGGKHSYPEFLPARSIVVMERTDRCGRSPTCPTRHYMDTKRVSEYQNNNIKRHLSY